MKRGAATFRPLVLAPLGLSLGLALVSEYTTALIALPLSIYYVRVAGRAERALPEAAVWVPVAATLFPVFLQLLNNTLCFAPALIATADDIDRITGAVDGALSEVFD